MKLPSKLSLARLKTPFYCLERLSARLGGPRLWIKRDDLTECGASGNKIRKLEFVLARALEAGCDTLVTSGGVQSNHCRATALLGARLGLEVHLLLRDEGEYGEVPEGNLFLDYLAGAKVTLVSKSRYRAEHQALVDGVADNCRKHDRKPWVIPVGASDGHGVWGYVNAAAELVEDFAQAGIRPQKLFHATGSGGTQAGLSAGALIHALSCDVIGLAVCDDADYFQRKVRSDLRHWASLYPVPVDPDAVTVTVNDQYIGAGYGIANEAVFDTIRLLAREEGIVLDPVYTGKAFHGMLEELRSGRLDYCSDIVFVHTGGIFGLMAQGHELGFVRPQQ